MRVLFMCFAVLAAACHNGGSVRRALEAEKPPSGFIHTTSSGYQMRARIGEQSWVATRMLAVDQSGWALRVEGVSAGKTMGFSLWLPSLRTGSRIGFFAGSYADLVLPPSGDVWKGTSGEVYILRIDHEILEGQFHFAAIFPGVDSVIAVTEGYFRVPLGTRVP